MGFHLFLRRLLPPLVLAWVAMSQGAKAQPEDADWTFYGASELDGKIVQLFFDSKSVNRRPDRHIEVWTKGLLRPDVVRSTNTKVSREAMAHLEHKFAARYVPPYEAVANVTPDQRDEIVMSEEGVNAGVVEPKVRNLYELDCPAKLYRMLSIYNAMGGSPIFSDKPTPWAHVPPETNSAALLKLLCPHV